MARDEPLHPAPVLDLARTDTVDQHDPYCDKSSRDCDLDHIEAFVEMDDGGPPGQTRPDNLAPRCRRHHRAKTHRGWTYQPHQDRTHTWTSPHGQRYTVDPRGIVTQH